MIDVHTHILPCIDDGARDLAESEQLLKQLSSSGITHVIFTPHFRHSKMNAADFIKKRTDCLNEILPALKDSKISYHLGAEVYLTESILGLSDEEFSGLCIDNGRYVLVEPDFSYTDPNHVLRLLHLISSNYTVDPIIAHIERYPRLFNRDFLEKAVDMGCLVQFDYEALSSLCLRGKIIKYINKGLIHLAGSDCHDPINRTADNAILLRCLKQSMVDDIMRIASTVLQDS